MDGSPQASSSSGREAVFREAIEALLQTMTPSLANAMGLGAIPHWTDRTLLARIIDKTTNVDELIAGLLQFQFARIDAQGHLHYRDEIREVLVAWQRRTNPDSYRAAHATALSYFKDSVRKAPATERQAHQREMIYHNLILDESAGIRLLNEQLEEVCYFHQLGAAEMLVAQAAELRAQLSEVGQMWLRYFEACLDMINLRNQSGEVVFEELRRKAGDQLLRTLSHWKLGQVRVRQQRWSDALTYYKTGLKLLPGAETFAGRYRARILISIGDVYADLAERSQVVVSTPHERYGLVNRFLNFAQNFPFIVVEWLVHRISFLPGIYFGSNYQDWIIAYLLYSAASWYRRAERLFAVEEYPLEFTEVNMALARIEHQLGRWSRARKRYARLETVPEVSQSRYRTAKSRLGQGQAYLEEGQVAKAITLLTEVVEQFRSVEDLTALGTAAFQLGLAYERLSSIPEAVEALLLSADAFQRSGDQLALTRVIWKLELLHQWYPLPSALKPQIQSLLTRVPERHLLTRFPHKLLHLYRNLALLISVPVSYVLAFLIGNTGADVLSFFEAAFLSSTQGLVLPFLAFVVFLIRLSFPILLAFWIFRLVYGFVGGMALSVLGYRLNPIEQEQPHQLVIDQNGLTQYSTLVQSQAVEIVEADNSSSDEITEKVAWTNIVEFVSADFKILHRPLLLISRTYLRMISGSLVLDGIIAGYTRLKSDIQSALNQQEVPVEYQNRDFVFLEWRWTLAVMLFSLGIVLPLVAVGQLGLYGAVVVGEPGITGDFREEIILLPISSVVTFSIPTLLLVLPATILWRLWLYQRRIRKDLQITDLIVPPWLLLTVAILMSLLAVGWILYLAFHP